jgi:hypothetical protein
MLIARGKSEPPNVLVWRLLLKKKSINITHISAGFKQKSGLI